MKTEAYAKLNLTLDITGRDERGYHLLSSVFAQISLCDTVEVTCGGEDISLTCDIPSVPTDGRNLCCKAAERFFEAFSLPKTGLQIRLKKQIPVCAGLGGGSSDAAAVLRLLALQYSVSFDDPALLRAASSVGADVPFFLKGGMCLAEGTGDLLTPLPYRCTDTVLVVKPSAGAETAEVYRRYDQQATRYAPATPGFLEALRKGATVCPTVSNHLSMASQSLCPEEKKWKEQLLAAGALQAEVTGSGSAVYGLFPDPAAAQRAKDVIQAEFAAVCRFC